MANPAAERTAAGQHRVREHDAQPPARSASLKMHKQSSISAADNFRMQR
jgi:hypothetical protein